MKKRRGTTAGKVRAWQKGMGADHAQGNAANESRASRGEMPTKREDNWRRRLAPERGEISAGLVLHMQLGEPATKLVCPRLGPPRTMAAGRFWICVDDGGGPDRYLWLKMGPVGGPGWVEVPAHGREGHSKWVGGQWHVLPGTEVALSARQVTDAAVLGADLSRPGHRSRLGHSALRELRAALLGRPTEVRRG